MSANTTTTGRNGLDYYHHGRVHLVDDDGALCGLDVPDDASLHAVGDDDPAEDYPSLCGNCRRSYEASLGGVEMTTVGAAADTKDAVDVATAGETWTEKLLALSDGEAVGVPDATDRLGSGEDASIAVTPDAKGRLVAEKPDGVSWDYHLRALLEAAAEGE